MKDKYNLPEGDVLKITMNIQEREMQIKTTKMESLLGWSILNL